MAGRLPSGWSWINSRDKKEGAIDTEGRRHTRQEAINRGAQEIGAKNDYELRQFEKHNRHLGLDPHADNGRYFAARKNFRDNLRRAEETAKARGEKWDRRAKARYLAASAAMGSPDIKRREQAKGMFLYLTGRTDRPEVPPGSP